MIRKLLIANRGEIACRIMRTARTMGIECAAVYSDADRSALHTQLADVAFPLGAPPAGASYLNAARIIAIARSWGADAIHPGYGFLSENSEFSASVHAAGMIFVGPDSAAIAAMGSKARAKELMSAAGVPLLPGFHGAGQSAELLLQEAEKTGFPILIKAVAGGGGRGLRIVQQAGEFKEALLAVQREAQSAFGDQRVLIERYLPGARHVEVQVFADRHGNCVHLFERDCSIQRRHQKLVEEAPAPGIPEEIRERMAEAAVTAAREINYTGAGTVEFLYQDGEFFFMEMNTRLQVEHPVTEAITGLDLVEWQLRVAQNEPLPLRQEQIRCSGWSMEARLNAEDPAADFMPGTGLIEALRWPQLTVRIDTGFRSGDRVSVHYDSLLAKIIVHAPSREQAAERLAAALRQTTVKGITTNRAFLQAIVESPAFRECRIDTGFLQKHQGELAQSVLDQELRAALPAAAPGDWGSLGAWRNFAHNRSSRDFHLLGLPAPGHDPSSIAAPSAKQNALRAPLPGRLIAMLVAEGDQVKQGEALLVMEAMKMEHTVRAAADCTVAKIHCTTGEALQPDQLIMEFKD